MSIETPAPRRSKKKIVIASFALLAVGIGGVAASGAYFTDQKSIAGNTLTAGTVQLGGIGDTIASTTPVTITNILPIDDSTPAGIAANATEASINIRNVGTADINWSAMLAVPVNADTTIAESDALFAQAINVEYSVDGGLTWSLPTTVAALDALGAATPIVSTSPLAGGTIAIPTVAPVKLRLWLPADTNNLSQAKKLTFTLTARAIQSTAPASANVDSAYTPLYVPAAG